MENVREVDSPNGAPMDRLCEQLNQRAGQWAEVENWPGESLKICGQAGVYRWFLPQSEGGFGWSEHDRTLGYLRLAEVDLTTTFVITQYMGAIRRIAGSGNEGVIDTWLKRLVAGDVFGTVGISHLTTSRQHLARPALLATETATGYRLEGQAPWVTGAPHADVLVVGATIEDGRQILAAVPTADAGINAGAGYRLVALSASCTDRVDFDGVEIEHSQILDGPIENVLQSGVGARPGGLQTSTLALGLARAAVHYLVEEASRREDLLPAANELLRELDEAQATLLLAADGEANCDTADIRASANRLVLRATQAALTAAKGAGFVDGHPVGRWCREALFFLVWSCPQGVAQAHLCEFAFGASS